MLEERETILRSKSGRAAPESFESAESAFFRETGMPWNGRVQP